MMNELPNAQALVKALRSAGMSQMRVAKHLGCSQAEISRWCNGKCKPGGELLLKLMALHGEKCGG